MRDAVPADAGDRDVAGTTPLLVVSLDGARYALPLAAVSEVADCDPLGPVPRAPSCVLGLAERHGRVITVLDLARLLGRPSDRGSRCLVRLAPPLDHLALAVPSSPRSVTLAEDPGREPRDAGEAPAVLLDPERLLEAAESGLPGAPRPR